LTAVAVAVASASPAGADTAPQPLPFAQTWTNAGLITATDDWSGVPGVIGYRGDGLASTGDDPQTVLVDGSAVVDVNANQANPNTFTTGGVAEFAIADPVVALQGSTTADAPHLVLTLSTAGFVEVTVSYDVRDIDGSADNAPQQVALQYRVGTTGDFTNLPAGYIADATTGPNVATLVTPVAVTLPPAADDQSVVQVRVITADAPSSDEWVGIDNLSVSGTPGGGGPAEPVASCPGSLVTVAGTEATAAVSATDADSAIATVAITSAPVPGITLVAGGAGAATLVAGASTAAGTYPVTITFATDDEPPQTVSCTVAVSVLPITPISDVQGDGPASLLDGQDVIVEGIVTSTFTNIDMPDGFFLQEEDADTDDDPATAEGLFVFCRGSCPTVAKGDLVQVSGVVDEFFGMTQVSATSGAGGRITHLSSGNALPTAVPVELPATGSTRAETTFEAVEGMVVTFPGTLVVSEYFELARYGQLVLTADQRPFQFTHDNLPSADGYAAFLADLAKRRIILDDDNNTQNDAVSNGPDEVYPYPSPGLSVSNRVRGGDTIEGLTGVLHWSFAGQGGTDAWRIRPIPGVAYTFEPANPVPDAPELDGDLKIASFNVLNYFTTIDETSGNSGPCGPSMTLDCRGADSPAELAQQRAKIVAAIGALDADVVGLIELQNDAGAAVADLVAGLNARPGALPYAIVDTGFVGGDAIKVAFIYRPARATPVGSHDILDSTDDPRFIDTRNRPAVIQTFEEVATGERFTAAINHFKSKGSDCLPDDPDLLDGQGNCNATRTAAATALAEHLAEDPTGSGDPDVIILGDLNSYRREDPIRTLVGAGYHDLIEQLVGEDTYSFLFDGQLGYLDHALANDTLLGQVTDAAEWHVNADEVVLFDYNDTIRDAGEAAFERESAAADLDEADFRRSSDHDPVVVGLDLSSLAVDHAVIVAGRRGGGTLALSAAVEGVHDSCPRVQLAVEGVDVVDTATTRIGGTCVALTSRGLVTFTLDGGDLSAVLSLPSAFRLPADDVVTFSARLDGVAHVADQPGRRIGPIWIAR
jgi:predicted extracellular nuclease